MPGSKTVTDILERTGALIWDGHFVLNSGLHSGSYINKDALYRHPKELATIAKLMATQALGLNIEVVIGPALGGIKLADRVAEALIDLTDQEVIALFAEKSSAGGFEIRRGNEGCLNGKRVLVVEDIITTGGSARKVVEAVTNHGGRVYAVAGIVNRGNIPCGPLGVDQASWLLAIDNLITYEPENCPLCQEGRPVNTSIGGGREFLERGGHFSLWVKK